MFRLRSKALTATILLCCAQTALRVPMNAQPSPHGPLTLPCTDCHTTTSWTELASPMAFNHATTAFALQGMHNTVACLRCHTDKKFAGTSAVCIDCHQQDFAAAVSPNHTLGKFPRDCAMCHTINGWQPSVFEHAKTNFQLVGAHRLVDCASCHANEHYAGLSHDCFSCHQKDFAKPANPNHVSSQFSHDCTICHSAEAWTPASVDHNKTGFPLAGAHLAVECGACHQNGVYRGTPRECWNCHQPDFSRSANPNHLLSQFSHTCTICHSMNGWKPAAIDHNKTSFPLTGAHLSIDCLFCHKNGQFSGTPADCYSCHMTNYTGAADPNHVSGNFDHTCTLCHTTTAWSPATFDHNTTKFPLTGAHAQTLCAKCHVGGKYGGTPTDCYACHAADYNSATNPNHALAKYPTDCASCHTTAVWQPSTFDHTPFFPINSSAVHRPGRWSLCSDCHTNPASTKTFSCITCHEHNQTSMNSEHSGRSGYSYDSNACYRCHPQGRGGG